jgi:hypothetical protein
MSEENPKMPESCFFKDRHHLIALVIAEAAGDSEGSSCEHAENRLRKAGLDLDNGTVRDRLSSCSAIRKAISDLPSRE